MPKRGMSAVIVTLLLVMLSIVLIGIVYVVISNIVKSGTEQTSFQFGTLFLDLSLSKVSVNPATGDVSVVVKRSPGGDSSLNLSGVAFVFSDGINSVTVKKTAAISELGSRTFTFTPADLSGILFVKEVQIAPIITTNGKAQIGREVDSSSEDYYNSCKTILKAGASSGDGTYTIDVDGLGALQPFKVYCDMTTDGGGWTLIARTGDSSCTGNFGWNYSTGSLNSFSDCYSLGPEVNRLNFTEIMWGINSGNFNWGSYVYKSMLTPQDLTTYENSMGPCSSPTPIKGGNTGDTMQECKGFTYRTNSYYMRDCCGDANFGMNGLNFVSTYCSDNRGGYLCNEKGMIMVR